MLERIRPPSGSQPGTYSSSSLTACFGPPEEVGMCVRLTDKESEGGPIYCTGEGGRSSTKNATSSRWFAKQRVKGLLRHSNAR